MRQAAYRLGALSLMALMASTVTAQQPPTGIRTGNPTAGTAQPEPPNLADRITLTGCVQRAPQPAAAAAAAPNTPSDSRFVLTNAKKNTAAEAVTYRLEAMDSQLSPFLGAQVEMSGEVKATDAAAPNRSAVLRVQIVRKVAPVCK
jgi:hypothetical protein